MQHVVLYCKIFFFAQYVSGNIVPVIRSSRVLYRWLLPVVLGALVYRLSVWCEAVGYVSGLRDNTAVGFVYGLRDESLVVKKKISIFLWL
jgi:hypothetical protein